MENPAATGSHPPRPPAGTHLIVDLSPSLVPALMPLLQRLRRLFDLDAEPLVIDAHLGQTDLADLVRRRPGIRVPAAFDGFETLLVALLRSGSGSAERAQRLVRRLIWTLGQSLETGLPHLDRLAPDAGRVAGAGTPALAALGIARGVAARLARVARYVADGHLLLEPGRDPGTTLQALLELGVGEPAAGRVLLRTLSWPDAFPAMEPGLLRAAGGLNRDTLEERAERWHPWRAYAAMHLWLRDDAGAPCAALGIG